jgi:hypothetical protein
MRKNQLAISNTQLTGVPDFLSFTYCPLPCLLRIVFPNFQFNNSLTCHLKLTETFCKPFVQLHLL